MGLKMKRGTIQVDLDGLWTILGYYGMKHPVENDPIYETAIPRFIELFRKYDLKATFFVIGRDLEVPKKRKLIQQLAKEGHEIANHTYNHHFGFRKLPREKKEAEISKTELLIQKATGTKPAGFKAPGYDLDEQGLQILQQRGYAYDSSVLPSFYYQPLQIANSILTDRFVRPGSFAANALCLFGITLIAVWLFIPFRSIFSFIGGLALGILWITASFLLFAVTGIWLSVIHPLLLILCLFVFTSIYAKVATDKEREHFFKLSTRDGLTGLFVIRHFRDVLNETVIYSREMKKSFAIILIDVDDFKQINDKYGHQAGDHLLRQIASMLLKAIRLSRRTQSDVTARYGGEEFIVLLPDTNLPAAAFRVAERIRKSVERAPLIWEKHSIPVTVSLGVATLRPQDKNGDSVIRRADEALYRAKDAGKNQTCVERAEQE